MSDVSPNHAATAGAAGLGANLAIVLVWLLTTIGHIAVPDNVALAIGGILTVACGTFTHEWIAARARREKREALLYVKPPNPPTAE